MANVSGLGKSSRRALKRERQERRRRGCEGRSVREGLPSVAGPADNVLEGNERV